MSAPIPQCRSRAGVKLPALLAGALLLGLPLAGQPRAREVDRLPQLSAEESRERLDQFRRARLPGDYLLDFELRHLPRVGEEKLFTGYLAGTWAGEGARLRVALEPLGETDGGQSLGLLLQNGPEGFILRSAGREPAEAVAGAAQFESLYPDLTYSAFDLQMPYLYWPEFRYDGAERVKGRPAQLFTFLPPEAIRAARPELQAVRAAIDDDYLALLRVDYLGVEGEVFKSLQVLNFKKVDGTWMIKAIDLIDARAREKTRFRVRSAAVNLQLEPAVFSPEQLPEALMIPEDARFERL